MSPDSRRIHVTLASRRFPSFPCHSISAVHLLGLPTTGRNTEPPRDFRASLILRLGGVHPPWGTPNRNDPNKYSFLWPQMISRTRAKIEMSDADEAHRYLRFQNGPGYHAICVTPSEGASPTGPWSMYFVLGIAVPAPMPMPGTDRTADEEGVDRTSFSATIRDLNGQPYSIVGSTAGLWPFWRAITCACLPPRR